MWAKYQYADKVVPWGCAFSTNMLNKKQVEKADPFQANLPVVNPPENIRKLGRSRDQTNVVLSSIEKFKPVFLLSLMCMFPEWNGTKFWSHSFHLQNSGIKGRTHEN